MGQAKWWVWGDEGVAVHARGQARPRAISRACPRARRSPPRRSRPWPSTTSTSREQPLRAGPPAVLEAAAGRRPRLDRCARPRRPRAAARACATSFRHRRGDVGRLPDVVVRPADEDELAAVVRAAIDADAVVIAFGGGTNISGSLEAPADEERDSCLGRPEPDGPGARDRRRPRAWPGSSPGSSARTSRSSSTRAAGRSGTSPTASATRRSAAGSPHARPGCSPTSTATSPTSPVPVRVVTPTGILGHPARARARRRVRACARWCWAARAASGSSARPPCTSIACPSERVILGYLFPDWPSVPRRDARHRRQRGHAVGHPRVRRRTRRSSPSPPGRAPARLDRVKSKTLTDRTSSGASSFDLEAMCLSFIGYEGSQEPRRRAAQARRRDRQAPRRPEHRREPRPALRPEEVRHALHPRLPARPRRARRTSRRPRRPGARCRRCTGTSWPRRRRPSTTSTCTATSCATSRTPTTPARACTSPSRFKPSARTRAA